MKIKGLVMGMAAVATVLVIGITALGSRDFQAFASATNGKQQKAAVENGVLEIQTNLEYFGYPALTVQKGVPVRWVITADAKNLNACNNEIVIPDLSITKKLVAGENVIEFTPDKSGILEYSCWMGMINSTIAVVEDLNDYDAAKVQKQIDNLTPRGGCCGLRQ